MIVHPRRLTSLVLCLSFAAPLAFGAGSAAGNLQARSCHLPGSEEALRCVKVPAPLDYAAANGARLPLHVTVAPAFREGARADPLFVLAGGPGQAGSDVLMLLNQAMRRVRATRDIVFIDQRGTGLSGKLDCQSGAEQENMTEAQLEAAIRACIAKVRTPFAAYTTANAARDIEQVRRALGYGKINLWGGSYGTRLGQAYARAYPGQVRALILDGVAAPDQIIPVGGRDSRAALDALFKHCAAEPACNKAFPALKSEFAALVAKVAAAPLKLQLADPRTAQPLKLEMNSERLLSTVHNILYSPADSRRLPFLIHSAHQGRWEPFVARRNVAADLSAQGADGLLLHLAVVCAEDLPRATPAVRAADDALLTAPMLARIEGMCRFMNVPAVPYAAPSAIGAPVLMLSGALDPVTPPRRAEAAGRHMSNAQHLVVTHAGHGISQLGCMPRLLREFLDKPGAPLAASCLKEIPPPTFQIGSAGPQP